ncbi:MAG: DUF4242 domain-containing protein [Desulfuromonadales bacterium]|nr:DUF4242 domain-containing protein [Desulfuromonadales bacterium]NIR33070.1 DUF4242 domain-containing protein [Desulfuromonadales bacterium]NIS39308.1 DUF4242 domain-containing protein [Desulfuromonadales bacterium]
MDVHKHLGRIDPDEMAETARKGIKAAANHGVTFHKYWYDKDEGTIFCLSEAPSKEAAMKAHRDAGEPVPEEIFEVEEGGV